MIGVSAAVVMERIGTEAAGFSVGQEPLSAVVRVVGWGFWGPELAQEFDKAVLKACRQANATRLILDMAELKPMRDEGQRAFASTFALLKIIGITHTSVLTASPMTKLQLLRIARDSAPKDSIHFG
jgi:hypothetical protein